MSLSYDIVKAHDGELKVETKVDEGNPDAIGKGGNRVYYFVASLKMSRADGVIRSYSNTG